MKWWRSSSGRLICVYVTNQVLPSMKTDPTELSARDWNKIGRNARNNFDSCAALLTSFEGGKKKKCPKNAPRGSRRNGLSFSGICGCVGRNQSTHSRLKRNRFFIHWAQKFFIQRTTRGPFQRLRFFFWVPRWNLAAIVHDICRWSRHTLSLAVPNVQSSLTWHVAP